MVEEKVSYSMKERIVRGRDMTRGSWVLWGRWRGERGNQGQQTGGQRSKSGWVTKMPGLCRKSLWEMGSPVTGLQSLEYRTGCASHTLYQVGTEGCWKNLAAISSFDMLNGNLSLLS